MAQTYGDIEILISDNASDDGTEEVCRDYVGADSRIRYVRHPENIGQNTNFTFTAQSASGAYLRWLGDDDWLDPRYLERTVPVAEGDGTVAVVTTYQRHVRPDGTVLYDEYTGRRPDGDDPADRLEAMLRMLTGSSLWCDPMYSLIRRQAILETGLVANSRFGDQFLACELAVWGKYAHVPECLSERGMPNLPRGWRAHVAYAGAWASGPRGWMEARSQRLLFVARLLRLASDRFGLRTPPGRRAAGAALAYYFRLRSLQAGRWARRRLGRPVPYEV